MSAPEAVLADAVLAALAADAGVKAALGDPPRAFAQRPAQAALPCLWLGPVETRPAGASLAGALEHTLTLYLAARAHERGEAQAGLAAARAALDDAPLSLAGRRLVLLFATYSDLLLAPDGRNLQGLIRLRAVTEPQ